MHPGATAHMCSIEFDVFGFSVKYLQTSHIILHGNSGGDLYTFPLAPAPLVISYFGATACPLSNLCLGHPCPIALASLQNLSVISCNKENYSLY